MALAAPTLDKTMADGDIVAVWNIPMSNQSYKIEFEHGTTSGKRVVRVNGKEIVRHDWMFKLVGRESFEINKKKCAISVDAIGIFAYEYTLTVDGKTYEKFQEQQKKALQVWNATIDGDETRICLEKDTMDVWVNGAKVNTTGEFVDEGTRTHFEIGKSVCFIESESSGKRKVGLKHKLLVNGKEIEELQM